MILFQKLVKILILFIVIWFWIVGWDTRVLGMRRDTTNCFRKCKTALSNNSQSWTYACFRCNKRRFVLNNIFCSMTTCANFDRSKIKHLIFHKRKGLIIILKVEWRFLKLFLTCIFVWLCDFIHEVKIVCMS